jgi:hypothetical protein
LKQSLVSMIADQNLQTGERLLGQNELAAHFNTTVVTMNRVMADLEADGVLHCIDRKGTFVGPKPPGAVRTRHLCLVLPGEHLDEPAANPDFWPYVRQLMHAFLTAANGEWRFASVAVPPGSGMPPSLGDLGRHDAVFFHHTKEPRDVLRQLIREGKTPTVAFGLPQRGLRCLTVDHDPMAGTRKAVGYLAGLGYRRVALAASDQAWGRPWVEGYRLGLADFGLPFDERRLALSGLHTQAEGMRCAAMLIGRGLPCDAILTDSDMRALGVLEYLRREGLKVPEDIGVMGYDGLDNATQQPPFLTSLSVPFEQMIRAALAEVDACRTVRSPRKSLKILGEIVPGQTVMRRDG